MTDNQKKPCCAPKKDATCCCCADASPALKKVLSAITIIIIVALVLGLAWKTGLLPNQDNAPEAGMPTASMEESDKPVEPLKKGEATLQRQDGQSFKLQLEFADSKEQQARGLMHRESLGEGEGMLFTYIPPQKVSFWMKNTPLSLDIFFMELNGTITKIVKAAKPMDTTPIPSDGIVGRVLELKAGEADRMGITVGDRLM